MAYAPQIISVALEGEALAEVEYALAHVKNGVERAGRGAVDKGLRAGRKQVIAELPQYINYAANRIPKRVRMLPHKKDYGYGQLRIYGGPLSLTYINGTEYVPVRQGLRAQFYPGKPTYFIPYSKLSFIGRTGKKPIIAVAKRFRDTFKDWPNLRTAIQTGSIITRATETMADVANTELGAQVEKLLAKHGTK